MRQGNALLALQLGLLGNPHLDGAERRAYLDAGSAVAHTVEDVSHARHDARGDAAFVAVAAVPIDTPLRYLYASELVLTQITMATSPDLCSPSGHSGPRWRVEDSSAVAATAGLYTQPPEIPSAYFDAQVKDLPTMEGKVVAITGCTTGTGYALAKYVVEKGGTVVLLNRPSPRAEAAEAALLMLAPGRAKHVPCDLTSFESVRQAASTLRATYDSGLDVLCCNAGVMGLEDAPTIDGYDIQIQVNHLSHFLLVAEVWPLLEAAATARGEARVVHHSSGARKFVPKGRFDPAYLGRRDASDFPLSCSGNALGWALPFQGPRWNRYALTKLANVVFAYALHDKAAAAGSRVKVLVAHPGLAATHLQVTSAADGGMGHRFSKVLMRWISQSAQDGSLGILRGACDPSTSSMEFYGPRGAYGPAVLEAEEKMADGAARTALWTKSVEATGAVFPW